MSEITLTILIVSRRQSEEVAATLASLAAWPIPATAGCEVIVIEDGGDDAHLARVQEAARGLDMPARVNGVDACGSAAARNQGLGLARGELVFCTLPGAVLGPDLPGCLRERFAEPELAALFGTAAAAPSAGGWAAAMALADAFRARMAVQSGWPTEEPAAAAYRRSPLLKAGGFPEAEVTGGACDLVTARLLLAQGLVAMHDSGLLVLRRGRESLGEVFQEELRRGQGLYDARRNTGDFSPTQLNQALQIMTVIVAVGLLGFLGPSLPANAFTLALASLLLAYPLNRTFIKWVSQEEPSQVRHCLGLAWLRPWAWAAGILFAAVNRMGRS